MDEFRANISSLMRPGTDYGKDEWIELMLEAKHINNQADAEDLFKTFDHNNDGFINIGDIDVLFTETYSKKKQRIRKSKAKPDELFNGVEVDVKDQITELYETIQSECPALQKDFKDIIGGILQELERNRNEIHQMEKHYKKQSRSANDKIRTMEEDYENAINESTEKLKQHVEKYRKEVSKIQSEKMDLEEQIEYYKVSSKQNSSRKSRHQAVETDPDTSISFATQQTSPSCDVSPSHLGKIRDLEDQLQEKNEGLQKHFQEACSYIKMLQTKLKSLELDYKKINDDNDQLRSTIMTLSAATSLKSLNLDNEDSGLSTTQFEMDDITENMYHNKRLSLNNYLSYQLEMADQFQNPPGPVATSNRSHNIHCDSDNLESPVRLRHPPSHMVSRKSRYSSAANRMSAPPNSLSRRQTSSNNSGTQTPPMTQATQINEPVAVMQPVKIEPERMFKLMLVGDASVGKTSFMMRFCKNMFDPNVQSTVGIDYCTKTIMVDGRLIAVQIWDTAGQERFRSLAASYFRRSDGIILLYDVSSHSSFLNVRSWIDLIRNTPSCENIPIMLLANKIDLRSRRPDRVKGFVQKKEGELLARNYKLQFKEISVKDNCDLDSSMVDLGRSLKAREDIELSRIYLNDIESKKIQCC